MNERNIILFEFEQANYTVETYTSEIIKLRVNCSDILTDKQTTVLGNLQIYLHILIHQIL